MSQELDEFDMMDSLQDDVNAAVNEMLPFEPDRELRDDTEIEEPVEAMPERGQADLEVDDVVDPLADLDMPVLEGLDE